jgi:leader peptidase (prepilin peptidase)/N-methyltransferase
MIFLALNSLPTIVSIIFLGIIALAIGSLATLLTFRTIVKQPLCFTRSRCIKCLNTLQIKNLIPVFSWLIQKGRCTFCNHLISIRYPLIELFFFLGFIATFYQQNYIFSINLLFLLMVFSLFAMMIIIDLEHYFIPNILPILLLIVAIFWQKLQNISFASSVLSAFYYFIFSAVIWAFFYFTAEQNGLGIDDLKFFTVSGFLLGNKVIFLFFLLSGFFGVVFGIVWQKLKNDDTFPFAPAMCLSCYLCLLKVNYTISYL